MQELVRPKISELEDHFDQLETVTKQKGERLFDANRAVLYEQSCDDIDGWVDELETQIMHGDDTSDLASLNILMQKQQMIETQMAVKAKQVRVRAAGVGWVTAGRRGVGLGERKRRDRLFGWMTAVGVGYLILDVWGCSLDECQ